MSATAAALVSSGAFRGNTLSDSCLEPSCSQVLLLKKTQLKSYNDQWPS